MKKFKKIINKPDIHIFFSGGKERKINIYNIEEEEYSDMIPSIQEQMNNNNIEELNLFIEKTNDGEEYIIEEVKKWRKK